MKGWSCSFVILLFTAIAFAQDFNGYIDINYTFQPEGIEYINFNGEVGFLLSSLNSDGTIYKCVDSGLCTVFSTGSGKLTGTVGLQMDVPNRLLYACNVNNSANFTDSASVAAINLDDGTLQWNADVTKLGTAGVPKLVNDVSPPDSKGNIYATESFQGLVFKVNSAGKASLFASGDLLAPQDELGLGANGIELLSYEGNEFLLVGVSGLSKETSPLVKIPLSNPSKMAAVEINSDGVFGFDGLYYDKVAEILYIVNSQENKVQKLASSDGFTTASLIDEQGVNCPGSPPSTVVHLNDPNLAGSAFVVCPNGFSRAGPYQIENVQFYLASTEYYYENYYTSASSSTLVFAFTLFFAIVFFAL